MRRRAHTCCPLPHQIKGIVDETDTAAMAAAHGIAADAGAATNETSLLLDSYGEWDEYQDPKSGATYFFNRETQVSSWDEPPQVLKRAVRRPPGHRAESRAPHRRCRQSERRA